MKISYEFDNRDMDKIQQQLCDVTYNELITYKKHWLSKSPEEIFNDSYEIAKWMGIYDYLQGRIYSLNDPGTIRLMTLCMIMKQKLTFHEIVGILYGEEMDYEIAMWVNWDDMDDVVENYLNKINK